MKHVATVQRGGVVEIDGTYYQHAALAPRVGQMVRVQPRQDRGTRHCHVQTLIGLHVCYALPVQRDRVTPITQAA